VDESVSILNVTMCACSVYLNAKEMVSNEESRIGNYMPEGNCGDDVRILVPCYAEIMGS